MAGNPTKTNTDEAEDRYIGQLVAGKYRVQRLVAFGGMGRVYQGIQEPLGRQVAIKVMAPLKPRFDMEQVHEGRFYREASICSRLSHPNTVVIHDYGVLEDGTYFLVMEYVDGETLRARLQASGGLGVRRAVHVAKQISSSLKDAHDAGVIHRDLKPPNILLVDRGGDPDFVKVIDFGLVKPVGPDEEMGDLTGEGMFVGSPVYMAPEQFFDHSTDQRSEIYSLGVIMYEMLAGRPPFIRNGPAATRDVIMKHMATPVPHFSEVAPDLHLPERLEALVMTCLDKTPGMRPQNMGEVLEVLTELEIGILSGKTPVLDRPGGAPMASAAPYAQSSASMEWTGSANRAEVPHTPEPVPSHTLEREAPNPRRHGRNGIEPVTLVPAGSEAAHREDGQKRGPGGVVIGVIVGLLVLLLGVGVALIVILSGDKEEEAPRAEVNVEGAAPDDGATPPPVEATPDQDEAPPAVKMVTLHIASTPPGAEVKLVDKVLGTTPLDVELPASDLPEETTLELSKRGFLPYTLEVAAGDKDELELAAKLQPRQRVATRRNRARTRAARRAQPARGSGGPSLDIKLKR